MNTSFRKIQWIVASVALALAGALVAGFRVDSAEVGAQVKQVRTEKLANVPGKSITAIVPEASSLMYSRGRSAPKTPRPDRSKSTRPTKASLSRLEVGISSVRMRAQRSRRACSLYLSPMTARS